MADYLIGGSNVGWGGSSYDSGGWLGTVNDVLRTGMDIYRQFQMPQGEPGDLPGFDLASGDPMTRTLFRGPGDATRYSPQPLVFPDPTGKLHFWGPMGRPLLWSRDLAAAKRVGRIAGKAARASGRRRASRKR